MDLSTILLLSAAGLLGYYFLRQGGAPPTIEVDRPGTQPKGSSIEVYTVQPGDTLSKIADRFEISYGTILVLNPQFKPRGQRDPDLIQIGESIRVS